MNSYAKSNSLYWWGLSPSDYLAGYGCDLAFQLYYNGSLSNGNVNGDRYSGGFSNDLRNGQGVYAWANGEIYEGEFVDNKMSGKGKYSWPSGREYEGYFENGKIVQTEDDAA